jgi:general secretion pathway protein K
MPTGLEVSLTQQAGNPAGEVFPAGGTVKLKRQQGVAVVTALLLTTLAVTIVASLFWQQQVQVRSMENQRLQLQTRWIVRGALDLSRLILNQDVSDSPNFTQLDGIWATPLEETRLDDYVERERLQGENFNATLSGRMEDAQGASIWPIWLAATRRRDGSI